MIQTSHIRLMLVEAERLSNIAEHISKNGVTKQMEGEPIRDPQILLERASNLAAHAAEELKDELLRDKYQGWIV